MEMENRHVSWWGGQPLRQELCVCFLKNSHYIHAHKHTHTHTHTHTPYEAGEFAKRLLGEATTMNPSSTAEHRQ